MDVKATNESNATTNITNEIKRKQSEREESNSMDLSIRRSLFLLYLGTRQTHPSISYFFVIKSSIPPSCSFVVVSITDFVRTHIYPSKQE